MASCLAQTVDGYLVVQAPQPVDVSTCTAVLLSGPEYLAAANPVLRPLTMDQGVQISVAFMLLWAVAFVFRQLRLGYFSSAKEEVQP